MSQTNAENSEVELQKATKNIIRKHNWFERRYKKAQRKLQVYSKVQVLHAGATYHLFFFFELTSFFMFSSPLWILILRLEAVVIEDISLWLVFHEDSFPAEDKQVWLSNSDLKL